MTTRVKICGIRTADVMQVALDAGADDVGLVFFGKSPRHVGLADAAALAAMARGRARIVALTVDADDALLADIVDGVRPDLLQLHGGETPERCAAIKARFGVAVMKAIGVGAATDIARAEDYLAAVDLILFDAKPLPGAQLPGGNGVAFDWSMLAGVAARIPYMLSGGLTVETVAAAIRATGARAVDVSSGVESAPGVKDARLIRAFVAAAKGV
jgi:phosphoribosylanthranilate isomerase